MTLANLFKLDKLTIAAYRSAERSESDTLGRPLEVQYNPETLSLTYETAFQDTQGRGTSSAQARFSHSRSGQLNVNLVFDGTNVGYFGLELLGDVPTVADRVRKFLETCYEVQSETHEPPFLKLTWGQGVLGRSFDCRLKSVTINYTAFDRNGSPLHAELAAVFAQDLDPRMRASRDRLASPDVSHRRTVRSGDTLPLLCREIYGSALHYLRVAEVNGLDDFRELRPGQELIFPPFERRGGR